MHATCSQKSHKCKYSTVRWAVFKILHAGCDRTFTRTIGNHFTWRILKLCLFWHTVFTNQRPLQTRLCSKLRRFSTAKLLVKTDFVISIITLNKNYMLRFNPPPPPPSPISLYVWIECCQEGKRGSRHFFLIVSIRKDKSKAIEFGNRNVITSVPQTVATTFAFASVFILLLWLILIWERSRQSWSRDNFLASRQRQRKKKKFEKCYGFGVLLKYPQRIWKLCYNQSYSLKTWSRCRSSVVASLALEIGTVLKNLANTNLDELIFCFAKYIEIF